MCDGVNVARRGVRYAAVPFGGRTAREGNFVLLLPLLLPVGALVLVLVFFRQVIGRAVVMNVDEDTLYDSLEEVLDRHGMSYREGRSTIDVVEHEATVEINYQATTNSGTVNARGDDQRDLFPVLEDLRSALRDKRLAERSRLAAWYVALGALIILSHAGLTAAGVFAGD